MLSKSCEYALRAMVYIAMKQVDGPISISKVSEALGLSFHYLTKILQTLNHVGLLVSTKGAKGGVELAKKPEEIQLIDIIGAVDGYDLFTECALGLPGCGVREPCPLHEQWQYTREEIKELFTDTTLIDLSKDTQISMLTDRFLDV